jgi:dephospho-CoA kinase
MIPHKEPLNETMDRGNGVTLKSAPLVVGLIGGIGSGKSQVAAALIRHGARVISGDELGHLALKQPKIRQAIVSRWGTGVLDAKGEIERKRLGAIVFASPAERRALEALVHPWIKSRIEAEVQALKKDPAVRLIVLDAAIMLEAGWSHVCDRVIYVDAPDDMRSRRLAQQRGWTTKEVEAREAAQLPLTEKRARADHVLDNSASLDYLHRQVDELLEIWGLKTPVKTLT